MSENVDDGNGKNEKRKSDESGSDGRMQKKTSYDDSNWWCGGYHCCDGAKCDGYCDDDEKSCCYCGQNR